MPLNFQFSSMDNTQEIALNQQDNKGEIILYQPDDSIRLDVWVEFETVWLTQAQMVLLFERERTVITKHINNIFKEGELEEKSNVHFLHIANSDKPVKLYNLDVIISVGYRVKSRRGTSFRRWATKFLREYILKGYAINQRFERIEHRIIEVENKIDFIVKTDIQKKEGIFFDGQIFDAYVFVANLIKSAKKSITLIDNYVDESVLLLLSKRESGVVATQIRCCSILSNRIINFSLLLFLDFIIWVIQKKQSGGSNANSRMRRKVVKVLPCGI